MKSQVLNNFKTIFVSGKWRFQSAETGQSYLVSDLFVQAINPKMSFLFVEYRTKAIAAQTIWTTSDFVSYWIVQMVINNATYAADKARLAYLANHLTPDLGKKAGKVHKQSEAEYDKAFEQYLKIYESF